MPEPLPTASNRLDRWRSGLAVAIIVAGILLSFFISWHSEPARKEADADTTARQPFHPDKEVLHQTIKTTSLSQPETDDAKAKANPQASPDSSGTNSGAVSPDGTAVARASATVTYGSESNGKPGTIRGRVYLKGTPPPEKPLPLDVACGRLQTTPQTTRFYVMDADHGLADVVIFVRDGIANPSSLPLPKPLVIDQVGCLYQPYVSGVMAGQPFQIHNADPLLHNVHTIPLHTNNPTINIAQTPNSPNVTIKADVPEIFFRIKCDVHPWMFAYVAVMPNACFAITDAHGRFELPSLASGSYKVEAYHRKLGTIQSHTVTITDNGPSPELTFVFDTASDISPQQD